MISATRILTSLVLALASVSASAAVYQVDATLQVDTQAPASAKASVVSGNTSAVPIGPGRQLQLATVRTENGDEKLRIRLLDLSSGQPVELHVAEIGGSSTYRRIAYGVCNGTVTFMSPASDIPFSCKG
jgi:hypothetical protein